MKRIKSSPGRPRLAVFRSNKAIYAQIIDDQKGITLAAASSVELDKKIKMTKIQQAEAVGEILAKKASQKKIKKVIFDRRRCRYHGRVKALANGARKGGLIF